MEYAIKILEKERMDCYCLKNGEKTLNWFKAVG